MDGSWWVEWISCLGFILSFVAVKLPELDCGIKQTALGMEEDIIFQNHYLKANMCRISMLYHCKQNNKKKTSDNGKNHDSEQIHISLILYMWRHLYHSNHSKMLTTTHNTIATSYIYSYGIALTRCTEKLSAVAYYIWHESPSHPKGLHFFIYNKTLWKHWGETICRQIWQKLGRNAGNHFNDPLNSGLTGKPQSSFCWIWR